MAETSGIMNRIMNPRVSERAKIILAHCFTIKRRLLMLPLQPTVGFSLLCDFLPFRPFLAQFSPPSYSHRPDIFLIFFHSALSLLSFLHPLIPIVRISSSFSSIPSFPCSVFSTLLFPSSGYLPHFLPFRPFLAQFSPPSYSHRLDIFLNVYNP